MLKTILFQGMCIPMPHLRNEQLPIITKDVMGWYPNSNPISKSPGNVFWQNILADILSEG